MKNQRKEFYKVETNVLQLNPQKFLHDCDDLFWFVYYGFSELFRPFFELALRFYPEPRFPEWYNPDYHNLPNVNFQNPPQADDPGYTFPEWLDNRNNSLPIMLEIEIQDCDRVGVVWFGISVFGIKT